MVAGGFGALSLDAAFAACFLFKQVAGDAMEPRGVLGGVSRAFAAQALVEGHVQYPGQFVFNPPVLADERIEWGGLGRKARDGVADLRSVLPIALWKRSASMRTGARSPFPSLARSSQRPVDPPRTAAAFPAPWPQSISSETASAVNIRNDSRMSFSSSCRLS